MTFRNSPAASAPFPALKIGLTAQVSRQQETNAQIVRSGNSENVDGFIWVVSPKRNCGPDRRDKATLDLDVQGTIVRKLIGNFLRPHKVARECRSHRRTRSHVHITAQAQCLRDEMTGTLFIAHLSFGHASHIFHCAALSGEPAFCAKSIDAADSLCASCHLP